MNFLACDLGGTKVLLGIFKKDVNTCTPNLILKKSNSYYENEFQINLNLLKINRFY